MWGVIEMRAILFVGHGSRDEEGNEQVRQFVRTIRPQIDETFYVHTCFLEFGIPSVIDGIAHCVEQGATDVIVIPIILLPAGHSKLHIPAAIDEARERYPYVSFKYGRPLGIHDATFTILNDRLQEAGIVMDEQTAVILLGRGGSDPDANSDLYKIARLFWERNKRVIVEPAFMGVTNPLLDEGVERCIKLGAKKIVILPYFLFTGVLIKRLEKRVSEFQSTYPNMSFVLAHYFGFHPSLQTIVLDRLQEALSDSVHMNCDTCQYRLHMAEHHHHHHDH
ncbi:sirohydrochlorin chelatase [Anoxybacillus flavithermus]|uniref:Sirohydrochlorin chelatase n=2 Tax=Anoxybacillaceae TaxID=3120669 RepID=A0A2G5RT38_9BACL|nr:sirohydrochlorin chelatase [Anoxybacillus flavithermus]